MPDLGVSSELAASSSVSQDPRDPSSQSQSPTTPSEHNHRPQFAATTSKAANHRSRTSAAALQSFPYFCRHVLAGTAIASSVMAIHSCRFVSYTNGPIVTLGENTSGTTTIDYDQLVLDKEPSGYYSFSDTDRIARIETAGLGLFSYSITGVLETATGDDRLDLCIRYEEEDPRDGEAKLLGGSGSFFVKQHPHIQEHHGSKPALSVARGFWVVALVLAVLAFGQLVLEWFCGCRRLPNRWLVCGFAAAGLFQLASVIAIVGFVPLPKVLGWTDGAAAALSPSCAGAWKANGTTACLLDAGAWFSLGSSLAYGVLALCSSASVFGAHYPEPDEEDDTGDATSADLSFGSVSDEVGSKQQAKQPQLQHHCLSRGIPTQAPLWVTNHRTKEVVQNEGNDSGRDRATNILLQRIRAVFSCGSGTASTDQSSIREVASVETHWMQEGATCFCVGDPGHSRNERKGASNRRDSSNGHADGEGEPEEGIELYPADYDCETNNSMVDEEEQLAQRHWEAVEFVRS
mmetsp:Transcript_30019/g.70763  ORF Transcript_30019/g.70763 Transcript_30019/m.70763 type:complete len:518 (+) Transcript_30019:588-2141(+)